MSKKNAGGCRACETCFETGKICSFDGDFNAITSAMPEISTLSRGFRI